MSDKSAPTAYPSHLKAQDQSGGPGLDSKMDPPAVWTQLEFWDDDGKPYLKEYEGRGLLKGKAALITGGDSGIGRSVAILMAREGANVTIAHLAEEEEDAKYTLKEIEKAGVKGHAVTGDLKDEATCKRIVDEHIKVHGKINILVNNTSMQEACFDHKDIDLNVVDKTFRTNVWQMMAMTKFSLSHMKRGDVIVNSCSVAGYMGNPELVDYSSSKGAIATFTKSLAQQQAPKGIRVNAVAPGIIWTPLQPATKNQPKTMTQNLGINEAPMQRPGMPIEVATAYIFAASPLGTYFTGEVFHGTGGLEMHG
ncbi:enoyl-(acyl carrier protein) reductase-like protein 2 [Elsinoe australis]|uniref:Enoyl-(Acyl carrier protein) reductase-like protein 2 n=1 Tax=Elsinoe australis TaxID=40998 RepID=A0A4U7AX07_9PEZI|nr:enoyl-(acyl carrier protein) reductase-like protein 2 [Elsinoe australis]